jgi:hypothetical protein
MAELYQKNPKAYYIDNSGEGETPRLTGDKSTDIQLAGLSDEDRKRYLEEANSPLTGEDVAELVKGARETGYIPTAQEVQLYKQWATTQNHSILEGIAQGFEGIKQTFFAAGNEFMEHPLDTSVKMPLSVVEGFWQGGRNLYGMVAQSQDPNSALFRFKSILTGDGSDQEAERRQFIDAMKFNHATMDLEEGKTTTLVDKDLINHKVATAASFIADPTLLVPYVGEAVGIAKAMRVIGIGERMAKIAARSAELQNKVFGNVLKWGVGTPIEFMGGAVRNTIDYGTMQSGRLVEAATGLPMSDWRATVRVGQLGTIGAEAVGIGAVPVVGDISKAHLAGTFAQGAGGALTALGDTIIKQAEFGRGINSYARQALLDSEKNGIVLSQHAKNLLTVLDKVDPLFSYANTITRSAVHGAAFGGTLGALSGGEEGFAHGLGAGIGLGIVGGATGRVMSDITGGTINARTDIQAKMAIEGWKQIDPDKAVAFSLLKEKARQISPAYENAMNGIIAGIDNVAPNLVAHIMGNKSGEFNAWLEKQGYNAETGAFREYSRLFEDSKIDRKERSIVTGILRDNGQNFAGDSNAFKEAMADPSNASKFKSRYNSLSEPAKQILHDTIDGHKNLIENLKLKGESIKDYYGNHSSAEAVAKQINDYHEAGETTKAREKIKEFLDGNRNEDGTLTRRGEIIKDKLRAEGYLDKDGTILQERNSRRADMTANEFMANEGGVIRRESDGKVHMYINTDHLANTHSIVPHELFHAIFRETAMKSEFMNRWLTEILGTKDENGVYRKKGSVDINELKTFFNKYIDIDSTMQGKDERKAVLDKAIENHQRGLAGETISDKTTPPLEHLAEEFGAYYFSHWLLSKPSDYLFRGGELGGIRGVMERVKNGWLDYWEGKMKEGNPTFDFSKGVDTAFGSPDASSRTRVGSLDYFMRDFTRAVSNSNRGIFDPRSMSEAGLRSFVERNGVYNIAKQGKNGKVSPIFTAEYDKANAVAGREIFKILNGLDPKLRTSIVDGEGNITGRLSPDELDAIVKSGHRNRAWADKIKQAYDILDGKSSNVVEYGYFGRTEQIGDYSWPRKTGKDVSFKNRKVILLDVETKIGADGKFYTLFHTLDKAVIEARGNNIWSNPEAVRIWGDRASMEADFFRYLENASKPEGDPTIKTSAELLEDGTGNGKAKRDFLHQMLGMAPTEGDAYINKPIAEIPYGIRQSVTTFNVDGISGMRVSNGARYDYNHNNAFKRLSRNWKPSEMTSEKTANGELISHASGYKFIKNVNGTVSAYKSSGESIGKFGSIEEATRAGKAAYEQANSTKSISQVESSHKEALRNFSRSFKPIDDAEYQLAKTYGSVWSLPRMKAFVGNRNLIPFSREEYILNRFYKMTPEELWQHATGIQSKIDAQLNGNQEYQNLLKQQNDWTAVFTDLNYQLGNGNENINNLTQRIRDISYHIEKPQYQKYSTLTSKEEKSAFLEGILQRTIEHPDVIEAERKLTEAQFVQGNLSQKHKEANANVQKFSKAVSEIKDKADKRFEEVRHTIRMAKQNANPQQYFYDRVKNEIETGKLTKNSWETYRHELASAMFGAEHDEMFQTGKPFVTVATHGTNSEHFAQTLLYDINRTGSANGCESARRGAFFAGEQSTSRASSYAENRFRGTLVDFWNSFKELNNASKDLNRNNTWNFEEHKKSLRNMYVELYKLYNPDTVHSPEFAKLSNEWVENRINEISMKTIKSSEDFISIVDTDLYNAIHSSREYLKKEGRLTETTSGNMLYQPSSKEVINFSTQARDARDSIVRHTNQLFAYAGDPSRLTPKEYAIALKHLKDGQLQLRFAIRMENPKVIFDPRNALYDEKYLSEHMNRAAAEGHDGIVFQYLRDGGGYDTVYTILKENVQDNVVGLESNAMEREVPRGDDFKTMRQMGFRWKPVEWINKDLMNHPEHKAAWEKIMASGAVVQNFDIKELEGKPVLNIAPDNSFVGSISVGDQQVMKGQGGVLFAINNLEKGGIWASTDTAAKRMYESMMTLRKADLARGGDGTIYISIPKAKSVKIASSENGARGYMNVINQLTQHDIVPREILQNAIRKAVEQGNQKFEASVSKAGASTDIVARAMDAFFSDDNGAFKARGSFVEKLVVEITKAKIKDPKRVADAQKTFGTNAENILTNKDVLMEAIGRLFDDPLTKGLNEGDVYAVIKVAGDFDLSKERLHDSYNTTIVHTGGEKPQLLLLDKPKHITELVNSIDNGGIASDKSGFTPEQMSEFHDDVARKLDEAKPRGMGFAPENEGKHHTSYFGINQTGMAAGKFKDVLSSKPTEGQGGRTYDMNSPEWKTSFIGKVVDTNPELVKDKNLEFVKRKDGSYRVTMTDNSGETQKVGHITATIDDSSMVAGEGVAEISSNIDPEFRGKRLANVLYSEMAERLRAMGIKYVDGTIVNKEGIPVQVRNTVIGQTYYKGSNRPAFREDAAKKIQALQSNYPSKGVGVYNELDQKSYYKPNELQSWTSETTTAGSIIKGSGGYIISQMNGKWRLYNPYKALVGIYNDEKQAKLKADRLAGKQ